MYSLQKIGKTETAINRTTVIPLVHQIQEQQTGEREAQSKVSPAFTKAAGFQRAVPFGRARRRGIPRTFAAKPQTAFLGASQHGAICRADR